MFMFLLSLCSCAQSQGEDKPACEAVEEHLLVLLNPFTLSEGFGGARQAVNLPRALPDTYTHGNQFSTPIAIPTDGAKLYYVTSTGLSVCALKTKEHRALDGLGPGILTIEVSPDGRILAACSKTALYVLDTGTEKIVESQLLPDSLRREPNSPASLSWDPGGTKLLVNDFANRTCYRFERGGAGFKPVPARSACYSGDTLIAVVERSDKQESTWTLATLKGDTFAPRETVRVPSFWYHTSAPRITGISRAGLLQISVDLRLELDDRGFNYVLDTSNGWHVLLSIHGPVRAFYVESARETLKLIKALAKP